MSYADVQFCQNAAVQINSIKNDFVDTFIEQLSTMNTKLNELDTEITDFANQYHSMLPKLITDSGKFDNLVNSGDRNGLFAFLQSHKADEVLQNDSEYSNTFILKLISLLIDCLANCASKTGTQNWLEVVLKTKYYDNFYFQSKAGQILKRINSDDVTPYFFKFVQNLLIS